MAHYNFFSHHRHNLFFSNKLQKSLSIPLFPKKYLLFPFRHKMAKVESVSGKDDKNKVESVSGKDDKNKEDKEMTPKISGLLGVLIPKLFLPEDHIPIVRGTGILHNAARKGVKIDIPNEFKFAFMMTNFYRFDAVETATLSKAYFDEKDITRSARYEFMAEGSDEEIKIIGKMVVDSRQRLSKQPLNDSITQFWANHPSENDAKNMKEFIAKVDELRNGVMVSFVNGVSNGVFQF